MRTAKLNLSAAQKSMWIPDPELTKTESLDATLHTTVSRSGIKSSGLRAAARWWERRDGNDAGWERRRGGDRMSSVSTCQSVLVHTCFSRRGQWHSTTFGDFQPLGFLCAMWIQINIKRKIEIYHFRFS